MTRVYKIEPHEIPDRIKVNVRGLWIVELTDEWTGQNTKWYGCYTEEQALKAAGLKRPPI